MAGDSHDHDHADHHGHDNDHFHGANNGSKAGGGHSHGHHRHCHGHSHAPASYSVAFATGIGLNLAFVVGEIGFGYFSHSLALVADAGHNLSDVLGLALAWAAATLAKRKPTRRFTYGLRSSSILAALANAVVLLISIGAVAMEAIRRFDAPAAVAGNTVVAVAAVGICVNGFTAFLFMSGSKGDLNIRAAFTHMLQDAAISAAVVVSGILIMQTGRNWIDSATSLLACAFILSSTWRLLKDSIALALDAVPDSIEPEAVELFLQAQAGVGQVHDLHIWGMSTTETALTCHLVMSSGHPGDAFLTKLCRELEEKFAVHHATIQIETGDGERCGLESAEVV